MPFQPTDTSADRLNKAGSDVRSPKDKKHERGKNAVPDPSGDVDANIRSEPNQANYGFSGEAELNSEAEETEDQEYMADGLPRTNKYSVDNTAHGTKVQNERRGRPDGC